MTLLKPTDPQYLTGDQYRDSSNLDARVEIHKHFSTNSYGWFNWVFDTLAQLPQQADILELGCGPAYLWQVCAGRIPPGWRITLSDLSDGMLDAAWRNLVVAERAFKFEQIDAQAIPYAHGTYDAVIANHMLYHVPDRKKALSEIGRVLKDDGVLIATTVGDNHLKEMHEWLGRVTINKSHASFTQPFTLENGLSQLKEFFSKVAVEHYPDNLKVTEVGPLIAYIRSMVRVVDLSTDALGEIKAELTAQLAKDGVIFISKDSGLFKAFN